MYVGAYETSSLNESFYNMRCLVMFISAVCLIFLLKLKWPKNKSAGADPGFFLGGGAPLRNDVTDR